MDLEYTIRKSKRARRIALRVRPEGAVEVVVPWYVPKRVGQMFFQRRLPWVKRILAKRSRHSGFRSPLPEPIKKAVKTWYAAQAKEYFETATAQFAQQLGTSAPRVKISDFRSQWGSCNRKTAIVKFSWRLMLAPEQVAHYVAAHEAAHLIQPNHSKKFWKLVAELDPEYRQARRWLRKNGHQLRF